MNTPEPVRPAQAFGAGTPTSPVPSDYSDKWERLWSAGISQGEYFDAERAAPSMVKLLKGPTGKKLCVGKSAVVPGCGRGYDLIALAELGAARVVGLELSESAVTVAQQYIATQEAAVGRDISMVAGDWLSPEVLYEEFDLGYDYTFFCALHPGMREGWADGWARRIKSGGTLLCLCFPVSDADLMGPPWPVSLEDYENVLIPRGFVCAGIAPVAEADATTPGRAGKEILVIWMKE